MIIAANGVANAANAQESSSSDDEVAAAFRVQPSMDIMNNLLGEGRPNTAPIPLGGGADDIVDLRPEGAVAVQPLEINPEPSEDLREDSSESELSDFEPDDNELEELEAYVYKEDSTNDDPSGVAPAAPKRVRNSFDTEPESCSRASSTSDLSALGDSGYNSILEAKEKDKVDPAEPKVKQDKEDGCDAIATFK